MDNYENDFSLMMLTEMGQELRNRTQAEHLYTAATIGSFGAAIWGVIPRLADQNLCAQVRSPKVMMRQG